MALDTDRIQAIFLAASEIEDPAERARHLDRECAGDAALRARVEALLRALDQPDSLLDAPVVPSAEAGPTRAFAGPEHANTRTIGHESGTNSDDEIPLGFLEPGTRPDSLGRIGHYEVLEVLGRGGFGIVFRAFDDVLQRVVAVKVMAPQLAATSPARKRFLREAQSSAAVRHENVVQVHEIGEHPLPYLVMEFIPGETLQQRLDRTGPLDVLEALRIGRQIAEGLAAAHATDLIHRDIKPGNVLIESGQQRVKITDFGLARAADDASISQSGVIAGTPMYMAPEQALGQKLDQRADLFSLGSVLYQMVSGRPPFRANSTVAVLKRVAEDTPRPIREIVPETPQWLCDIIAKLHAKNPDERFQSARDVADVLTDCETQLKAGAKLKDFSRIPTAPRAERAAPDKRFAWLWWLVPVVGLIFALASMWSFSAMRLAINGDGEIEVANDSAWVPVIVRKDGNPVFEVAKGTTMRVPSGRYTIEMAPTPVKSHQEWRITTHDFFSSKTATHTTGGNGWIEVNVSRGERVTVRVVVREESNPEASSSDGFTPLFNGKDLTGWKTHPEQPGDWKVNDGILVGNAQQSHLFSERADFTNFHLRVELKINAGGDGGIRFRTPFKLLRGKEAWQVIPFGGYEAEFTKFPNATAQTGSLWRVNPDGPPNTLFRTVDPSYPRADEWCVYEVIADGNRFTTKFDGKVMANCTDTEKLYAKGHLALQCFSAKTHVQFRKIEIKELPPSVPATDDERLQGTWVPFEAESGGVKMPAERFGKMIFAGDKVRVELPVEVPGAPPREGTFKLGAKASPKELDVIRNGDFKGMRGIYRFDGDVLTVCVDEPGPTRPSKFETGPDTGTFLVMKFRKAEITEPSPTTDYALDFTAVAAHVAFPDLKLATAGPMTLEAFVTVRDTNPSLVFNMRTPDHVRITLGESVGFWVGANAAPLQRVQLGESLPVGRRVHLACVFDGKKPHLFIDGIRRNAPLSMVKFPEADAVETRLGSGKNKNLFNGVVDEFRISTVARYKGDFTPEQRFTPDKDTFALYHCDEGTGDLLKDSSGNGRHGKIAGVTWVKVESAK